MHTRTAASSHNAERERGSVSIAAPAARGVNDRQLPLAAAGKTLGFVPCRHAGHATPRLAAPAGRAGAACSRAARRRVTAFSASAREDVSLHLPARGRAARPAASRGEVSDDLERPTRRACQPTARSPREPEPRDVRERGREHANMGAPRLEHAALIIGLRRSRARRRDRIESTRCTTREVTPAAGGRIEYSSGQCGGRRRRAPPAAAPANSTRVGCYRVQFRFPCMHS
jgi:hypothetical protein